MLKRSKRQVLLAGNGNRSRIQRKQLVVFWLLLALIPLHGCGGPQEEVHLTFQGGYGGNNFETIWGWLTGHLKEDSTWDVSIEVIPSDGIGGLEALRSGRADFTLVKAPPTTQMAYKGIGLFDTPDPQLRSFGLLPVTDWLTLAVGPDIEVDTVKELVNEKQSLRIATGRDSPRDVVTFLLGEILRFYGVDLQELEAWGSQILRMDPGTSLQAGINGEVDVVFQEASSIPLWGKLFEKGWKVLSFDDAVLDHLHNEYGFARSSVPPAWYQSDQPAQTIAFSNVVLCVREDVPEEIVNWVTRTFWENKQELEAIYRDRKSSWLDYPIDPEYFASETLLPHHSGAVKVFNTLPGRSH